MSLGAKLKFNGTTLTLANANINDAAISKGTITNATITQGTISKLNILNDGMRFGGTSVSLQDFTLMTDCTIKRTETSVQVVGGVRGTAASVDQEGVLTGSVTVATDIEIFKRTIWIPDTITITKSFVKLTTLAAKDSVEDSTDDAKNDTGIVATDGNWYSVL